MWFEKLGIPFTMPTMSDQIKIQVRDWDRVCFLLLFYYYFLFFIIIYYYAIYLFDNNNKKIN